MKTALNKAVSSRSPLWGKMWIEAGIPYSCDHEAMYHELLRRYCEPHRRYHNFRHIGQCMAALLGAKHLAHNPLVVSLALWFHDAVYEPGNADNEKKSAELLLDFAEKVNLDRSIAELAARSILATTHSRRDINYHLDTYLVLDIDLSSLGKIPIEFDADTNACRQEFPHLTDAEFLTKNVAFLTSLLERKSIYYTEHFRQLFEERARSNISRRLEAAQA
jgi:predicted metal-dependent HD superfamily phosphohydrolase